MRIVERIKDAVMIGKLAFWRLCAEIAIRIWIKRNWNRINAVSQEYAYLAIRLKAMEYFYRTPAGKCIAQYVNEDYPFALSCYEMGFEGKEYAE
uniref:Uncharacterized protein n=1 Tax=Siphoviridae sp. ctgBD49 TaxID=2826420 RepID=A0A8S5QNV7_9CAUD|nr:MAG TPA: hypothetical protein [Siphoviridae sp. ctgBD49]DAM62918.1 MAG TPA: hypothetical protein [Caudoviricetes sp.]